MTEQELREWYFKYCEKNRIKVLDVEHLKFFNLGYSLAQETIEKKSKEIEEAFQEKMELFDVISRIDSQLKEAVRHIDGLLEQGCSDNVDQFLAKYKGENNK